MTASKFRRFSLHLPKLLHRYLCHAARFLRSVSIGQRRLERFPRGMKIRDYPSGTKVMERIPEWMVTACTSSRIYCDNIISGCSGCLVAQINDCDYFFGFWNSHNPNISKAIAGMKFPTIRLIPIPEASPTGTVGVMKELLIATPAARVARPKHPIPFFCRFVMFYYTSKIYWTTAENYSI